MNDVTGTDRVKVRVLLTFGDQAELVTPTHSADNPLRVPAEQITRDTGLPAGELPGRQFTAHRAQDGTLSGFQLLDDPRTR
ncbi:hypothetical protein [Thermomonospora cellulosilytica]|uniref:Uncharacterized protein n=1 Tax=Thermomonospora cellulosilytica TaxID=1411118 RepID=A0A7W3RA33_9ACTN|nr:hypothetical protein [Thermomonospora cellulosilytica]MBA9005983.1 hypothetical protein [Thermomonospora cellulosilytica]